VITANAFLNNYSIHNLRKVLGKNAEENAKKFLWPEILKKYLEILKN